MKKLCVFMAAVLAMPVALTAAKTIVLADFEDSSRPVSTYKGDATEITTAYSGKGAREGKQCLTVKASVADYAGALISVDAADADWTGLKFLSLWVKGKKSGGTVQIIVEDAGKEQFASAFTDDQTSWKQVILQLSGFKSRTDWQASDAVVNDKIDWPVASVHFFTANKGDFDILYDLITVSENGTDPVPGKGEAAKEQVKPIETGEPLRVLAAKSGLPLGTAVTPFLLSNGRYADLLAAQFDLATPGNSMKWDNIHPEKDRYDFAAADRIVDFAQKNRMKVHGHTLCWHLQNPKWLGAQKRTRDELLGLLKSHITSVVGRYKGKVLIWDVVNEPFESDGLRTKDNIWQEVCGEEYIEKAFVWARAADPAAKLILNEYAVEAGGPKADVMFEFVRKMKAKGVPIDGVGFQFHITAENPPDLSAVWRNFKRFADLGLDIHVTELDVRIKGTPTARKLGDQARIYADLLKLALSFKAVASFSTWGFTDRDSWVPGSFPGYGTALPFDSEYNPKPAFFAMQKVLSSGRLVLGEKDFSSSALAGTSGDGGAGQPFRCLKAATAPLVNGKPDDQAWKTSIVYPFCYNQLSVSNLCPPEKSDLWGRWRIVHAGNMIYGLVERNDDRTVTDNKEQPWLNDNVEVFFRDQGVFVQLRSVVGAAFETNSYPGKRECAWSADGKVFEFMIQLSGEDLTGRTIGWNIGLSDNDRGAGAERKYQLYPVNGANRGWQGMDLSALECE